MPMTVEAMQAAVDDPETGSIRRRWLRRALAGVVAVGPTLLHPPPSKPTRTENVARVRRAANAARDHEQAVSAEIAAVDRHVGEVARKIEALESTSAATYALQEMKAEHRMLGQLRGMLEADLAAGPIRTIRTSRDGRELVDRDRAILRMRARELAESMWTAAARADGEGDHRRARMLRIDALRARQIAEYEIGLRPSLPGYGMAAWT